MRRILVISLSNIGDVLLTCPVIDVLLRDFPEAELSVVVGPKAKNLLLPNPRIKNLFVYQKNQAFFQLAKWVHELRRQKFDMVVDLRNTAIPFFLFSRVRTSPILRRFPKQHMLQQHLRRLASIYPYSGQAPRGLSLYIPPEDDQYVSRLLEENSCSKTSFVVLAPGAASGHKRWSPQKFSRLADEIILRSQKPVVLVGDKDGQAITRAVRQEMSHPVIDLSGQTTLIQLVALLTRAALMVSNDSGPMHLGSYLQIPVVGIFGPTDPIQYGPWSSQSCLIERRKDCPACQNPKARLSHECLERLEVEDVMERLTFVDGKIGFKNEGTF